MGLEAGKFFVNLGLTGAEKMLGGLSQINDHFSGLKGISTEAKLAILAALAGMEQMISVSGKFGTQTTLTAEALGAQTKELQKWNNAFQIMTGNANQGGIVLKTIRDLFQGMKFGKGVAEFQPTLMALLAQSGETYTPEEMKKQYLLWASHPEKFMPHLMDMAKLNNVDQATLAYMLEQSGQLSPENFSALRNMTPTVLKQAEAESLGNKDIEKLNVLYQKWQLLGLVLKKDMDEFASTMGPIVDGLLRAANLLDKFMQDQQKISVLTQKGGVYDSSQKIWWTQLPDMMQNLFEAGFGAGPHLHHGTQHITLKMSFSGVDNESQRKLAEDLQRQVKPLVHKIVKDNNKKLFTSAISTQSATQVGK